MDPLARFFEALRDSQLLQPEQLEEVGRLLAEPAADLTAVGKLLVGWGWLTAYQVKQLQEANGAGLVLGPYQLLELIGEGGMGQVFKAWQPRLNRVVALKLIRKERLDQDPEAVRRFRREAKIAAQLSHPNVVHVYDADQTGDTHFIAMEYVEGTDLSRLVKKDGPLPVARACDYIRQAALGLQHAHERGLIHRDIKPSNLLVARPRTPGAGPPGGISGLHPRPTLPGPVKTPVEPAEAPPGASGPAKDEEPPAVVKIMDLGLARMVVVPEGVQSESSLTREGTMMGTPDYIAPEQARNSHLADARSDVYSLGCTLYFLLTGKPPFPQGTVIEKLLMHQLEDPQPVEELRPDVPKAVLAILRKMMAKQPRKRYQAPGELADALGPWCHAEIAESIPEAPPEGPDPPTTSIVVVGASSPASTRLVRQAGGMVAAQKIAVLKGHHGLVMAVAFSGDRDLVATGGVDGAVRLWDFRGHRPTDQTLPHPHPGEVRALTFAPDNRVLASGSGALEGEIGLWDLAGEGPTERGPPGRPQIPADALAFAPDGKVLASGHPDLSVRLWAVTETGPREKAVYRGHGGGVLALAFAPDGKTLASASQDGSVRLWHVGRLWSREQAALTEHGGHVRSVAFAPDGKTLASACQDGSVRLWDVSGTRPAERTVLQGHKTVVRLVLFAADGTSLVSCCDGGQVIRWEWATGTVLQHWRVTERLVCSVALTPDGRYVAAGHNDGTVTVFRLGAKKKHR